MKYYVYFPPLNLISEEAVNEVHAKAEAGGHDGNREVQAAFGNCGIGPVPKAEAEAYIRRERGDQS